MVPPLHCYSQKLCEPRCITRELGGNRKARAFTVLPRQFVEVQRCNGFVDDATGIATGSSAFTNDRAAARFSLHYDIPHVNDILGTVMNAHIIAQTHNAEGGGVAVEEEMRSSAQIPPCASFRAGGCHLGVIRYYPPCTPVWTIPLPTHSAPQSCPRRQQAEHGAAEEVEGGGDGGANIQQVFLSLLAEIAGAVGGEQSFRVAAIFLRLSGEAPGPILFPLWVSAQRSPLSRAHALDLLRPERWTGSVSTPR